MEWHAEFVRDRSRLVHVLSAADVYAFPSRHEGLPAAPMEAMACSIPVVGADAPGAADILAGENSGGLLVPVGDARPLADALEALLIDDQRRRAMGAAARRQVKRRASLDAVAERLGRVLRAGARFR